MSDLISRQAAVERFDCIRPCDPMTSDYTHGIDVGIALCKVAIREQPPAQLGTNLASLGTDCISRQAAIDAARKCAVKEVTPAYMLIDKAEAMTELMQLPSIQPKRGKWIYCEDSIVDCVDGYRCDQCGFFVPWDYQHKSIDYIKDYNFCPHCGSYNGGKRETDIPK